ncbi:MAG: thioredoxin family protein [Prevotella sp.]|nr:thioredoxin family protein [Bacteroides sp.]MCM1366492.1 thioredoxin family protein [Prevotella sp.]MCM1436831.1 thioredoxin family protein [Prevotella sp.]
MDYREVITSAETVLVEFYASWCPHCQRMMPIVAQVAELLEGKVPVYQYDIDEEQELAQEAGVTSIPTFIVYNGGREVWRHTGEIEGQALLSKVQDFI